MDQPTIKSRRIRLHKILCDVLGSDHVYFDPPESVKMKYPCIVYERSDDNSIFADDTRYNLKMRYSLTLIDKSPDSEFLDRLLSLPYCYYDRHFTSDNLHHDALNIYY